MSGRKMYAVELRGYARQTVYVHAESKAEARSKATEGDCEGEAGYPDWERNPDGSWAHWPAKVATEASYWEREEA